MEKSESAHDIFDRRHLGRVALQKFQTRGHVGEEVTHFDHHTGQEGTRALLHDLAGTDPQSGSTARAFDVGDRGDARQGFATKPDRTNRGQVRELRQELDFDLRDSLQRVISTFA